jgi:hypothetical protein
MSSELEADCLKRTEMIAGGDGTANTTCRPNGPQLVNPAVVLVPNLVGASIGRKMAIARAVGVIGRVMDTE